MTTPEQIGELRKQIIESFSELWELNDKAHRKEHFEEVFQTAMVIDQRLGLGYDPKWMLFAAYFHDMFAWSRNNHHTLSYEWLVTTDHPLIVNNLQGEELRNVYLGCQQHRASFKGEFSNRFAELINSADRGLPGRVTQMRYRAVMYREKHNPEMTLAERRESALKHLKEKFGTGGYARYPDLYIKAFGAELEEQRKEIDALTV